MFTNRLYVGYINVITEFDPDAIYSERIRSTLLYRKNDQKFVDVLDNMKQIPYNPLGLDKGAEFVNLETLISLNKYIIEFNEQNDTSINLGICSSRKKLIKTLADMKLMTASKNG